MPERTMEEKEYFRFCASMPYAASALLVKYERLLAMAAEALPNGAIKEHILKAIQEEKEDA